MRNFLDRPAALFFLGAILVLSTGTALAQGFPNKPIRMIVPTSTGATADFLARILAPEMSRILGQPVVVENKPGANQIIGLEYIAKGAPADGYTIGVVGIDGVILLPLTTKGLRFDPMNDLVPIAGLAEGRYVMASPADRPWKSFDELVDYAKSHPGKLNYGSSVHQVRFPVLLVKEQLELDVVHIPFSSGAAYLTAILSGILDFGVVGENSARTMGTRGRILAMTGQKRSAANPEVPTFAEIGFPQAKGPAYGLSVRAGTPKAISDKLSAAAASALGKPEIRAAMSNMLLDPSEDKPEMFARKQFEQAKLYADFAKGIGLQPQ
jgi:tripartite-type tricarboxylate transporter receptor subunit TctC